MTAPRPEAATAWLDPLDNPALRRELPGLATAFDGERMRALLERTLLGSGGRVDACEPGKATYLPNDSAIVRYTIRVGHDDHVVCGRLFPDAAASARYVHERLAPLVEQSAGRPEVAPFAAAVAHLEPLAMAVSVFPIDGDLPMLAPATDPARMAAMLGDRLGEPVERCRVEVVAYKRRGRCVLRYALDPGGRTVYGKITAAGEGASTPGVIEALRATLEKGDGHAPVRVPHTLGYDHDLCLLLMAPMAGTTEVDRLLRAWGDGRTVDSALTLDEGLDACARTAAMLHTSGIALGEPRTFASELAGLRARLDAPRRFDPALGAELDGWLDRAEQIVLGTAEPPLGLAHGDYTLAQLVFDHGAVGLLDFDDICQAEPALDLGQFSAYLQLGGTKRSGDVTRAAALVARFGDAYVEAAGVPDPAALASRTAAYEILSFVRIAEHAWHKLKGARLGVVLAALEGATSWRHHASR